MKRIGGKYYENGCNMSLTSASPMQLLFEVIICLSSICIFANQHEMDFRPL
jgi:hypothetical protein